MAMSEATSRRIRAIFNTFNFWCIVLYNIVALNGLDFSKLVAKRLLLKGDLENFQILFFLPYQFVYSFALFFFLPGFPITTTLVMFVTYCLIQVIKERERKQALIDDPDPLPPAPPLNAAASPPASATTASAAQPVADPSKEKAE